MRALLLLALLALLPPARAQMPLEMERYIDEARFSLVHPKGWRRERPASGPIRLIVGQPPGDAFVLCSVEHAAQKPPLNVTQMRLDRDLVNGFKTRDWPQELAGRRKVLTWQVRDIGGVPMGAVEWERADYGSAPEKFARGIKVFRITPRALWSAECASIALSNDVAEAHFRLHLDLIAEIVGSVQFPR